MAGTNDFLSIATAGGANVDSQADFAGSGYQTVGLQSGLLKSAQMNKMWRQASSIIAALTNLVATFLDLNVVDDGNISTKQMQIQQLIQFLGSAPLGKLYTFSATPAYDLANGNVIEMTLTGNITAPTLTNSAAGSLAASLPYTEIIFIYHQDGTGGHTVTWPSPLPDAGAIDSAANSTSIQRYMKDGNGNWQMSSPMLG